MSAVVFGSGTVPQRADTRWNLLVKMVLATTGGGGGGGGTGGAGIVGTGSPEGAVTASPGTTYLNNSDGGLWMKRTGTGNTGWFHIA